jgi:Holliday junction DNA helicase RuvA
MICRIHGILEDLRGDRALIGPGGGLTYQVLLPAYAVARLAGSIGQPVTLHTIHYLEGSSQGSNLTPRLAGFVSETDRGFFELFTTVKGIGPRKALRAMSMSTSHIAAAIADRDAKMLQALPEIGKRTAETIIASLHDRVDGYLAPGSEEASHVKAAGGSAPTPAARSVAREALEVLVQLGENRVTAMNWIDQVITANPDIEDPQVIITEVLRLKTSV